MTIPEGFELEPVQAGTHPAPDVPSQQKTDIYDDAESHFKTTDEHAVEVNVAYKSVNCVNTVEVELPKTRLLFDQRSLDHPLFGFYRRDLDLTLMSQIYNLNISPSALLKYVQLLLAKKCTF